MGEPANGATLAEFVRRVRGHGVGGPRRVLVVGPASGSAAPLRSAGFAVVSVERFPPADLAPHAFDGVWFDDLAVEDDALDDHFRAVAGALHHGLVRVPVPALDGAHRWRVELALERAQLRVVHVGDGLIAWTKLVSPLLGAGGIIFDDRGRILLSDRADRRGWCIPGGVCDADESPFDAAVREVREEVGLEVELESLLGIYATWNVYGRIIVTQFICRWVGGTPRPSDEVIDVGWFGEDAIPEPLLPAHRIRIADAFAVRRGEAVGPFLRDTPP